MNGIWFDPLQVHGSDDCEKLAAVQGKSRPRFISERFDLLVKFAEKDLLEAAHRDAMRHETKTRRAIWEAAGQVEIARNQRRNWEDCEEKLIADKEGQ